MFQLRFKVIVNIYTEMIHAEFEGTRTLSQQQICGGSNHGRWPFTGRAQVAAQQCVVEGTPMVLF
jgi:hypothetical protein